MNSDMAEISRLFSIAEKKIKLVEVLDNGLLIPAINQLRYVGCHILRSYEAEGNDTLVKEELEKAKNHCKRAIYDAVEIAITHNLEEIKSFIEDYKTVVVVDIVPNYLEIREIAKTANKFLIENVQNKDHEQFLDNLDDQYKESLDIFEKLKEGAEKLNNARPEINKKLTLQRRTYMFSVLGLVVVVIGIIVGVLVRVLIT